MEKYKSATITVDTSGTEVNPDFDILSWSVFSSAGDYTVEVFTDSYGDAIPGFNGISTSLDIDCQKLRIKSTVGSVAVTYLVKGQ